MTLQKKYEEHPFLLTDTLTGKKKEFKPSHPPKVLFYSCGPTVYGPLHIGNARALIVADLLYRWLQYLGYEVEYVRNYTDVDDKIIARAQEEKLLASEVSKKYIDYCETDMKSLGLRNPSKVVTVTESMDEIIQLIQKILNQGHAYVVEGEVFFSIESFSSYGKLSGKNIEELQAGARVEVDHRKKSPFDFSLWKPHKAGEPFWESPWGKGRPGWHIECSAMAIRWLGPHIDLHHGGQDLIFPHHENEIAQSESATGAPFCTHWVHNAFMLLGHEKMSKSLGNTITIRDFVQTYGAEVLKFIFFTHHYRSVIDLTEQMFSQALDELERVYLAKKWANQVSATYTKKGSADKTWSALVGQADKILEKVELELFSDYNSPGALGHLFSYIRNINRAEMKSTSSDERKQVAAQFLNLLESTLYPLFNLFGEKPETILTQIEQARKNRQPAQKMISEQEIKDFIAQRNHARAQKNFKQADEIRLKLDAHGVVLVDNPTGTTWKYK